MRIGVDAFNLAADRRGMGRVARTTLSALALIPDVHPVLLARDGAAERALSAEFAFETAAARRIWRAHLDAVWFPWNGMRFRPHAPSVVTIYDAFAFTYPARGTIARLREQSPIRRAIRNAGRILTLSHWSAGELGRLFGVKPDRIDVSPPGLDPFWHAVEPPQRDPYVLFVGGPDERKNAAMLLEAYDGAFAKGGPVLVIAGVLNDRDERRLRRMRARYERVRPDDAGLRELYSGALAVAVPSLAEGYGLPAIEAMACGAPVIASDASALPEACGGAALLIAPRDVRAWSDALSKCAADAGLRSALRARGYERTAQLKSDTLATALLASVRRLREGAR